MTKNDAFYVLKNAIKTLEESIADFRFGTDARLWNVFAAQLPLVVNVGELCKARAEIEKAHEAVSQARRHLMHSVKKDEGI